MRTATARLDSAPARCPDARAVAMRSVVAVLSEHDAKKEMRLKMTVLHPSAATGPTPSPPTKKLSTSPMSGSAADDAAHTAALLQISADVGSSPAGRFCILPSRSGVASSIGAGASVRANDRDKGDDGGEASASDDADARGWPAEAIGTKPIGPGGAKGARGGGWTHAAKKPPAAAPVPPSTGAASLKLTKDTKGPPATTADVTTQTGRAGRDPGEANKTDARNSHARATANAAREPRLPATPRAAAHIHRESCLLAVVVVVVAHWRAQGRNVCHHPCCHRSARATLVAHRLRARAHHLRLHVALILIGVVATTAARRRSP